MKHLTALTLALVCALLPECKKKAPSSAASSASAAASASAAPVATAPHLPRSNPGCRAIAVKGLVTLGDAAVITGSLLDGERWLTLASGARLSIKHTLSGRELELQGPATAMVCRHGSEQILLSAGQVATASGMGARPGAEVLIATPLGTIRYGDAALDADVGPKGLRINVKQGEVWLEPEALGSPPFTNPLHPPKGRAALTTHAIDTQKLLADCEAAAKRAEAGARNVVAPTPDAGALGDRVAEHVKERGQARAACSIAAAAAGLVTDPAERQNIWAAVTRWDGLWQSVPRTPSAQK
ncbi:MAG TPA: hypothetical protein VGM29_13505 [Polyangiaceae bacterium]